uniref:Uncharacterized protein n=1 Tax=Setaria italica TaxID=4555 RepID=K3ZKW8_SETIT
MFFCSAHGLHHYYHKSAHGESNNHSRGFFCMIPNIVPIYNIILKHKIKGQNANSLFSGN